MGLYYKLLLQIFDVGRNKFPERSNYDGSSTTKFSVTFLGIHLSVTKCRPFLTELQTNPSEALVCSLVIKTSQIPLWLRRPGNSGIFGH